MARGSLGYGDGDDLARLRLNRLIRRRQGTNTYDLTPDGQRVATFYTKVHDRLLSPSSPTNPPPPPKSDKHWPPSTATSAAASTTNASQRPA
ncbi:hypothetical protein EV644_101175 [Kribbella orskensis]|uniref:Winged helix DNA-binding protein n=1 Tax=Kribbella orskensis TaxID=2512216 RepID=A0ABY2BTV6_9ACTN|nr:hypothetical protein EV642_101814 [Kribbella sp. VKM Ac-2500]TCO31535.1 hypothetical protein EV644_101175 [Kribbella orskensis]